MRLYYWAIGPHSWVTNEFAARACAVKLNLLEHTSATKALANYRDAMGFLKMAIGDPASGGAL